MNKRHKEMFNVITKKYAKYIKENIIDININNFQYEIDYDNDTINFMFPEDKQFKFWNIDANDLKNLNDKNGNYITKFYGDYAYDVYCHLKDEYMYGTDDYGKIKAELINAMKNKTEPLLTKHDYKKIIECIDFFKEKHKDIIINNDLDNDELDL